MIEPPFVIIASVLGVVTFIRMYRYIISRSWPQAVANLYSCDKITKQHEDSESGNITYSDVWHLTYAYSSGSRMHQIKTEKSVNENDPVNPPKMRHSFPVRYNPQNPDKWIDDSQSALIWTAGFAIAAIVVLVLGYLNVNKVL